MFNPNDSERGAFLEQMREAREERQAERKRDEAAIKIQSLVRGYLTRIKIKREIRSVFDLTFKSDGSSMVDIQKSPHSLEIFMMARKFFHIYNKENDSRRLEIYTRYLLASMGTDDPTKSYVTCAMNKKFTVQWIQHIKLVTVYAMKQLEELPVDSMSETRLVSVFLHLLLTFSATSTWRLLQQESLAPLRPTLNKLTQNVVNELVSKGLYQCLQQVLIKGLCRGKPALRDTGIITIITIALRPLVSTEQPDHIFSLIAAHILSVPGLVHHLTILAPDGVKLFHNNKAFEKILGFVYEEQNMKTVFKALEGCYALCLLANLVHLAYLERESTLMPLAFPKFTIVVHQLLNKCKEYVSTKQSRSTQWHLLLGWFSQSLDQPLTDSLPIVKTQMELLWSGPLLKIMFEPLNEITAKNEALSQESIMKREGIISSSDAIRPKGIFKKAFETGLESVIQFSRENSFLSKHSSTSNATFKFGSPEVMKVCIVSSMYYLLTCTLAQLKMDILTGICYRSEVLRGFWILLLSLGPQCGLKVFLNLISVTTKTVSPEFHFLILFCDATTQLVSVLDDMEMYEQQKPFSLEDYTIMSNFLNLLIYKLIKNGLIDVKSFSDCPLFNSAHQLLMLLYRRDSRRKFAPQNHWNIGAAVSTISDMDKGKAVAVTLIRKVPHILPHEARVILFRNYIMKEKISLGLVDGVNGSSQLPTLITIRRNVLVEDGYRQLASLAPASLKGTIRVRFVNEQGLDEAGIDQDGVFKEFLEETLKQVFHPSINLFKLTNEECLYPSPISSLTDDHLELLEFTGKMLAKAVYEGIVVDCPFASFFLSQLLGEQHSALYSFIDELPSLDAELYKNLTYVKHYDGDVSDLSLTFCYDEDYLGRVISHELRPGGKGVCVTNDNKILYVHLMAMFKLHTQIKDQTRAFIKGFKSIIQQEWLQLFSVPELQRLISGDNVALDIQDLRQNTHYYGGFHDKHRVIMWLWDILKNDFTEDEKKLFLKFVTSCSKPPLLGFANLEPPFCIRCVEVNDDEDSGDTVGSVLRGFFAIRKKDPVNRLPTSSTCFNLLKLPNYQKKSTLKEKLRYAIHSNTGFELS